MDRRELMKAGIGGAAIAMLSAGGSRAAAATGAGREPSLPKRERVRAAFILGPTTNVIDVAGTWEVFQDVYEGDRPLFEIYTVAEKREPVQMTGGMMLMPNYTFDDAPQPHVLVIPAMIRTDAGDRWLLKAHTQTDVTMSVCTGAFHPARLGILDGLAATTHHDRYDDFERQFPKVRLLRGRRWVDNGKVMSAGGLTSGIDLSLHVVARYFGDAVAERTAVYLEHDSTGWRTGIRAGWSEAPRS